MTHRALLPGRRFATHQWSSRAAPPKHMTRTRVPRLGCTTTYTVVSRPSADRRRDNS
jgi:hypothetical protein